MRVPPVEIVTEETLFDCDVFIFCATKAVPPVSVGGDVRMAQYEANKGLVKHFACLARERKFSGLTCIVSDPVDPLCRVFFKRSGSAARICARIRLGSDVRTSLVLC